jgi:hypothetical protein
MRHMLLAVFLAALALGAYRFLSEFLAALNDTPYVSSKEYAKSWYAGPSPEVVVDVFAGNIYVVQATDGNVTARVRPSAVTNESQTVADGACAAIRLEMTQGKEGTIRITALVPPAFSLCRREADVVLHVPQGVRLDLHTRRGDIRVGEAYVGANLVRSPPAVRSIKARADFDGKDWSYHGDIFVETAKIPAGDPRTPKTDLQLEGVQQIEIHADEATVQARARGGAFVIEHETATGKLYSEEKVEGSITFVGTLSEGHHSFWAADRADLRLPAGATFDLDAEASGGAVTSGFPVKAGGVIGRSRLQGIVGASPRTLVRVRVDKGRIRIEEKL